MTTLNEADRQPVPGAAPLGAAQLAGAAACYLTGLTISYVLSAYDVKPMASVCLTALNAAASWALLRGALGSAGVTSPAREAAALWVPLTWDFLLLGQLPYIGFFFVPLEATAAGVLLRRRAGLRWSLALAFGFAARLLSLGLVYAARLAARMLFPWSG